MKKLLSNGLVKAVAVGLFILSVIVFVLSTVAIVALSEVDAYKKEADFDKQRDSLYSEFGYRYACGSVLRYVEESGQYEDVNFNDTFHMNVHMLNYYYEAVNGEGMNFDYEIYDQNGTIISKSRSTEATNNYRFSKIIEVSALYGREKVGVATIPWYSDYDADDRFHRELSDLMNQYSADSYEIEYYIYTETDDNKKAYIGLYKDYTANYPVKIMLYSHPMITDYYSRVSDLLEIGYSLRYTVVVLCVLSLVTGLLLFFYLILAAGHRKDREGIVRNPIDKIPYDLFTLLVAAIVTLAVSFAIWILANLNYNYIVPLIFSCVAAAVLVLLVLILWIMSTATRIKYGKWWRNTLAAMVILIVIRGIIFLCRSIPLIWKTILFLFVVGLLNLISAVMIADYLGYRGLGVLLWIFDWILITFAVLGCSLSYHRLSKGAEQIARGGSDARINTDHLFFDFKTHGENLNNIGEGIRRAVDEQMKSERMKTELITNVSHDIKTPLTSIINYVDLLAREGAVTEDGTEYLEVLSRQSARLKKLIEDLIQASKASTGNLETHMVPTDSAVLAEQIVGEYQDRMENAELDMICQVATQNATILADGQLLYRVFDNLLGNICKYAQPGTRVYLDVIETAGKIRFFFRNISANPLHISPDELTERFVRGDASRTTEGSGLGLSIAKSLTELQGGSFEIEIDGDLFKAILQFDRIE